MATVANRANSGTPPVGGGTVVLLRSVNTPDYPPASYVINPDLSALTGVPIEYWKIVGDTIVEMSAAEKTSVDSYLLPQLKLAKAQVFDAHTQQILAEGVEYPASSGDFYSILPADLKAFELMRDVAVFPYLWHAINFTGVITINNATQANALLSAAADKLRAVLQDGATLLEQIRSAADKAALDAIVDPR